jgi:hypothetical protein
VGYNHYLRVTLSKMRDRFSEKVPKAKDEHP